jgi:DNA-binding MarR family transcriptional regulator
MALFEKLRALRAFKKKHLPFLETIEDFDLLLEIAYHQERGTPLTMKQVYLLGIASMATVQRRLRRLRQAGAIHQVRCDGDGRSLELRITPRVLRVFTRYAELNLSVEPAH